jgi:hypothetical protein
MRAKRFVEGVMQMELREVLDDGDFGRVLDLSFEAIENSTDHVLVGFRVRGPVLRIVWAVIEVIPLDPLTDEDLPPSLLPGEGWKGRDLRLDGLWFSEGLTADLDELDEAKPPELKDAPAILVSYPGRVSWEKLRQTFERPL